jgi:hypothetical protein
MESAILQAIVLATQDGKDTIARFHSLAIAAYPVPEPVPA